MSVKPDILDADKRFALTISFKEASNLCTPPSLVWRCSTEHDTHLNRCVGGFWRFSFLFCGFLRHPGRVKWDDMVMLVCERGICLPRITSFPIFLSELEILRKCPQTGMSYFYVSMQFLGILILSYQHRKILFLMDIWVETQCICLDSEASSLRNEI